MGPTGPSQVGAQYSWSLAAQQANPGTAYLSGMMNQQALAQSYQQTMAAQQQGTYQPMPTPKWMIDGKFLSMEEFAQVMFGKDTAEQTAFILKYSGK